MLLDGNIIIYAALPEYAALQDFIAKHAPAVSAISRVEVLGYHLLTETDRRNFAAFFAAATFLFQIQCSQKPSGFAKSER